MLFKTDDSFGCILGEVNHKHLDKKAWEFTRKCMENNNTYHECIEKTQKILIENRRLAGEVYHPFMPGITISELDTGEIGYEYIARIVMMSDGFLRCSKFSILNRVNISKST